MVAIPGRGSPNAVDARTATTAAVTRESAARANTRLQAPLAKKIAFALGCRDDNYHETSPDGRRLVCARASELRSDASPTRVQTLAMRFLLGAIHKPPTVTPQIY
jgi:hypothetical protein